MEFHQSSLVTQKLHYLDDKQQVITVIIGVLTKLGRKGPSVDRKSGVLFCEIRKPRTPWFGTSAEVIVEATSSGTNVVISITCEKDDISNRAHSVRSMKALLRWLLVPSNGLHLEGSE